MPKPFKGNLSEVPKLVKWYLKDPKIPKIPFTLLGQPYITVTGDRFFEVLRKDCEKFLLGDRIHGQARLVGELRSLAMMSQQVQEEETCKN